MRVGSTNGDISDLTPYLIKASDRQSQAVEGAKKTDETDVSVTSGVADQSRDEYVPGTGESEERTGVYSLAHGENGEQKVVFSDRDSSVKNGQSQVAEKQDGDTESTEASVKSGAGGKTEGTEEGQGKTATAKTEGDDDSDDDEEALKKEKQRIEQQLRSVENEDEKRQLEKRLSEINAELSAI